MKTNNLQVLGGIALIVSALFFVSKSGYLSFNNPKDSQPNAPTSTPSVLGVGQRAPDFNLTTLDNQQFRLSDKKEKTVILFGMAGWCGTCIPEGRVLTKISQEYANKGIEVIGVAFTKGDNDDFLKEFKKVGSIDIPLALDTDNVAQKYNLTRLETTYIIKKDRIILYKDEQSTSYEDYKRELDKII